MTFGDLLRKLIEQSGESISAVARGAEIEPDLLCIRRWPESGPALPDCEEAGCLPAAVAPRTEDVL